MTSLSIARLELRQPVIMGWESVVRMLYAMTELAGTTHSHARIEWIDVAKGIGIILVSFGHIRNGDGQSVWLPALDDPINALYLFHMPFFFFLGGLTFNTRRAFSNFVWQRVRTLIVPYYVFSIYFLAKPIAVLAMPSLADTLQSGHSYNVVPQLLDVLLYGNGLWFLWAYFWGEIITYPIVKLVRQHSRSGTDGCVFATLGIIMVLAYILFTCQFPHVMLPFRLLDGVEVSGFMLLGIACKPMLMAFGRRNAFFAGVSLSLGFIILATPAAQSKGVGVGYLILFSTGAMFLGVFAATFLSRAIDAQRILAYIGRYSLMFYAVNALMMNVGKIFFFRVLPIDGPSLHPILQWAVALILTAFSICLMAVADYVVRRWAWWAIGAVKTT